jgi:transcriptional regulator with XRE-family HTH domain
MVFMLSTTPESLRTFRERVLRITQGDLASMLGIKRSTYANYELGVANPPKTVMDELSRLGYSGDEGDRNHELPRVRASASQLRLLIESLKDVNTPEHIRELAYQELIKALGIF